MTANERAFQEKWLETNSGRTLLEFWVNEKEMIAKSAKMSDLPAPASSFLLLLIVYHIIQTTKGQTSGHLSLFLHFVYPWISELLTLGSILFF